MQATDHELLDRWRAGDEAAGQQLLARHFDSIYRFFDSKCERDADELVQATFLACLRAKQQFRAESSFRTYLFTIARNTLYRHLRMNRRDGERLDFEHSSIAELVPTPASRIDRNADYGRLLAGLRRLPVAHQALLELHYWEGLGIDELATIFEAPEVTIRSRLHRARKTLRELMEGDPAVGPGLVETLDDLDAWARSVQRAARPREE